LNFFGGVRTASAAPLTKAYPATIIAALLAGKTIFTWFFFEDPVGFLRHKHLAF
jgi:hypothetical protein